VSILAQIQQGPPFQDNEMPNKNPPNRDERLQLKLSIAFAHLAVADTDVVAVTLYTPEKLTVVAWIQDQNSGDQDKPEPAQDTQKEPELMPGSNYQGPSIVKPTT
jgi:hypothetical protein